MKYKTLDDLISELNALKAQGISGDTPVGLTSGRTVAFSMGAGIAKVAKADLTMQRPVCSIVSRQGVGIVVIREQ